MKTKVFFLLAAFTLIASNSIGQEKQKKFGFEINGGLAIPVTELAGSKLNPGAGFEALFHYRFVDQLGVYAGWGYNMNKADDSFAGLDTDFEETGYVFGLQYNQAFGKKANSFYFRAAGLYNHIEVESKAGDIIADTGHGLGFQLAAGIDFPVGKSWVINPGFKFNSLSREIEFENNNIDLNLNYLSARIGIVRKF